MPNPLHLYEALFARYGDLHWWPAQTPYEMMVGAVLTQNTAWTNVEKAIANFNGNLTPERVEGMDTAALTEIIRPAGFFNQKCVYLKALTAWYKRYNYSTEKAARREPDALRNELLSVRGIGRETADCLLLYAFGHTSFVVDAYTLRLFKRLPVTEVKHDYENVRSFMQANLPRDVFLYRNFHACIVENAKIYCRAKPRCTGEDYSPGRDYYPSRANNPGESPSPKPSCLDCARPSPMACPLQTICRFTGPG